MSGAAHIDSGSHLVRIAIHNIPERPNELVSADCLTFNLQGGARE